MRSRPSNLSGAASVTDAVPPTPIATGRGRAVDRHRDARAPTSDCRTRPAPRSRRASSRRSPTIEPIAAGRHRQPRGRAGAQRHRRCRRAPACVPAAVAVSASAPLPSAPRRLEQEARLARQARRRAGAAGPPTRPASAVPGAVGRAVGLERQHDDLGEAAGVQRGRAPARTTRGNGASCRSTSVSRAAPRGRRRARRRCGRRAAPGSGSRRVPGDRRRPDRSCRSRDPHRHRGAGAGVEREHRRTVQRDARGWRGCGARRSPSSTTSSATCGKRSAGGR